MYCFRTQYPCNCNLYHEKEDFQPLQTCNGGSDVSHSMALYKDWQVSGCGDFQKKHLILPAGRKPEVLHIVVTPPDRNLKVARTGYKDWKHKNYKQ